MIEPIDLNPSLSIGACIEALLFVAPGPVAMGQIAAALDVSIETVEAALKQLEQQYHDTHAPHGIHLQRHHGRVQLTTTSEYAPYIERFLGLEATSRLSRAALETLAIVAYQEPVTRPQIDAIRGVNSDAVIKNILNKGLIQEVGRAEAPGRPILYSTTTEFLQLFGLNSLAELPPLELSDLLASNEIKPVADSSQSENSTPEPG
jgi:segregation and condensation protein B